MQEYQKKSIQEIVDSLDQLWEYYKNNKGELLNDYIKSQNRK